MGKPVTLPTLLTTAQLAEYLHAPVRTLEYWRSRNYGPAYFYVGKRAMYREDDVAAWIENCSRSSG